MLMSFCNSACGIASLCASPDLRMHMRMSKGDVAPALLTALVNCADLMDGELILATSCVLFFLSRGSILPACQPFCSDSIDI